MNQCSVRHSDPFNSLVGDVFSDFFQRAGRVPARAAEPSSAVARARMDVVDKGDKFEIKVDLPGVSKEDINVSVEGPRVTLQAESRRQKETREGERVLHSERSVTSYARSFELPVEVTDAGAEATFENGVLTLALPKRIAVAGKRLDIR
jgi:HSP20 family protein